MPDSAEAAGVSGHRVGMEPTAEGPAEEQPWFLQRVAASRSSCLRVPQASCENQRVVIFFFPSIPRGAHAEGALPSGGGAFGRSFPNSKDRMLDLCI